MRRRQKMRLRQRRRRGFTLIELVASAVLASMLMITLMNVVWSAHRDIRQLKKDEASRASTTLLVDRLRVDFQNARGMLAAAGEVRLQGFLSQDADTLQPTFMPATIQYASVRVGDRSVLVRSVVGADGASAEPIWSGFGAMRIEPLEIADKEDDALPDPAAGDLPQVPYSFRVTLSDQNGNILWREIVNHHAI